MTTGTKWAEFWRRHDPDEVFAYSTVKIVKIQDRRLGILHYVFILGVIVYIIGIVLLMNKNYLKREVPNGEFQFSFVSEVAIEKDLSQLAYCVGEGEDPEVQPDNCIYWDAYDAVVEKRSSGFLLTTYTEESRQIRNCTSINNKDCLYQTMNDSNISYYTVEPETFKLIVTHNVQAATLPVQASMRQMHGELLKRDPVTGEVSTLVSCEPGSACRAVVGEDTMSFGDILEAAGIDSLDAKSFSEPSKTLRQAGTVLVVILTYTNEKSYNYQDVSYTYEIKFLKLAEHSSRNVQYRVFPGDRYLMIRHGLSVIFIQSGMLGWPDMQTVLLQLVSGMAILGISTVIVDGISTHFLPQKKHYKEAKYQVTEDFSDLREGLLLEKRLHETSKKVRAFDKYSKPKGDNPI